MTSDATDPVRPDPRFYDTKPPLSVVDAAKMAGAEIVHSEGAQRQVSHVAPLHRAGEGAVIFVNRKRDLEGLTTLGQPALVLTTTEAVDAVCDLSRVTSVAMLKNPKAGFAALGHALHINRTERSMSLEASISAKATISPSANVSPQAVVMAGAVIGDDCIIGPFTLIGVGVSIGEGTVIASHCTVTHAMIGRHCRLHAGVRVGEPGFGYVGTEKGALQVPQLGRVQIHDHVELGANTTIDRGALEDTIIGAGTKMDNLVQVAHNANLGKHVLIASQTGISGSCKVGDGVLFGGQSGMADHLTIGEGAIISAKSGVMKSVPPGEQWGGTPAKPAKEWMRDMAAITKLRKKDKAS